MHSLIAGTFQAERQAVLISENYEEFVPLDSKLTQAAWSRIGTNNLEEELPADLQRAASEMLKLMKIRQTKSAAKQRNTDHEAREGSVSSEAERQLSPMIGMLIAACRRLSGKTVAPGSK